MLMRLGEIRQPVSTASCAESRKEEMAMIKIMTCRLRSMGRLQPDGKGTRVASQGYTRNITRCFLSRVCGFLLGLACVGTLGDWRAGKAGSSPALGACSE